jgi:hypothetical protein
MVFKLRQIAKILKNYQTKFLPKLKKNKIKHKSIETHLSFLAK